jgi:glycosyltransferase involved in cell wall biosynthesis
MQSTRTSDADMLRAPVSCCIITKNEGDRIERCILSVRDIVDEIVVVDSGSEDTVEKAKAFGAKIFVRKWDGFGPQKRYAEECATYDWILNLDADEVATPPAKSLT